jgi:hypothetical protein
MATGTFSDQFMDGITLKDAEEAEIEDAAKILDKKIKVFSLD